MADPTPVNSQITDLTAEKTPFNTQVTDIAKESGPQEMPGRAAFETEDETEDKG